MYKRALWCFVVRGLYTYQARGPDEVSISEGDMLELSSGSSGGKNYSEEWWEGECLDGTKTMTSQNYELRCSTGYDTNGKKGIFPSNYVRALLCSFSTLHGFVSTQVEDA